MSNPFSGKYGPLLIAEIGGNHEGNFEYAKKLVELGVSTEVDMVKFQIYTGDSLVSPVESPDRNKHFKKFELSRQQHVYLAEMVREAGKEYTSSVWDPSAIEWIDPYINIYKIGSGDLTAYPILKKIASIGKPIILSTGLSTEKEVLDAVNFIQQVNKVYQSSEMLALLQCTSMYPIRPQDAHLCVMKRLKELTRLTVGYSDHTEGSKALFYAVAAGAEIIEFHFTDSREGKQFRDHKVSLIPTEIGTLVEEIKLINTLMGTPFKTPIGIEVENHHEVSFRRAVYPSRDIKAGEIFTEENLIVLRPNHGVDARRYFDLVGKTAKTDLKQFERIELDIK